MESEKEIPLFMAQEHTEGDMKAHFINEAEKIGLVVEAETHDERILMMCFGRQGEDVTTGFGFKLDYPGRNSVAEENTKELK